MHFGKSTQDTASVIAFEQAQFGRHQRVFMHPLDGAPGAPGSPGLFAHRHRALPQQGRYQCPAAFGQSAEARAGLSKISASPWCLSA
jgi:hypothetical protein